MASTQDIVGHASNVRNPAAESLQAASLGVQQGSAGVAGGINELSQALMAQNQAILRSFQKQQDTANMEKQAEIRQLAQSFEGAVEKMATASMRKSEQQREFRQRQSLIKSEGEEQERIAIAREERAKRDAATQAKLDADEKAAMARVGANIKKATQATQDYYNGIAEISKALEVSGHDDVDPQYRDKLSRLYVDALGSQSEYDDLPIEFEEAAAAYAAKVQGVTADRLGGRTETPMPEFQAPPMPGGIESNEEAYQFEKSGQSGPPAPPRKQSIGAMRAAVAAMMTDMHMSKLKTADQRAAYEERVFEASVKTQQNIKRDMETRENFIKAHDLQAQGAINQALTETFADPQSQKILADGSPGFQGGKVYERFMRIMVNDNPDLMIAHKAIEKGSQGFFMNESQRPLFQQYKALNDLFGAHFQPVLDEFIKGDKQVKALQGILGKQYDGSVQAAASLRRQFGVDEARAADAQVRLNQQPLVRKQMEDDFVSQVNLRKAQKGRLGIPGATPTDDKYGPPPETTYLKTWDEMMKERGLESQVPVIQKAISKGELPPTVTKVQNLRKNLTPKERMDAFKSAFQGMDQSQSMPPEQPMGAPMGQPPGQPGMPPGPQPEMEQGPMPPQSRPTPGSSGTPLYEIGG